MTHKRKKVAAKYLGKILKGKLRQHLKDFKSKTQKYFNFCQERKREQRMYLFKVMSKIQEKVKTNAKTLKAQGF